MAGIGFSRAQEGRRPLRLVGGIRIFLGLQADGSAALINNPAFAGDGAVEEVPRIHLDSGLIGVNLQVDAGRRAKEFGGNNGIVAGAVQHPVMVVAVAVAQLLIIGIDVLPYQLRSTEIHRSPLHRPNLPGGHESIIHGSEGRSVDIEFIVADRMIGRIPGQIEVGVIGHVDDRGRVGSGLVPYTKSLIMRELSTSLIPRSNNVG